MKLTAIMTSLFAVVFTVGAHAATSTASDMTQHEVLFNLSQATGAVFSIGGQTSGADSPKSFGLGGGYNYHVAPGIQVGINKFQFNWTSVSGSSTTNWDFLAGVTLNWPMSSSLNDAWFLALGAGLEKVVVGTGSEAKFQFGAEVGKRITIVEHVNYRPSLMFMKRTDRSASFAINLLAFSATF